MSLEDAFVYKKKKVGVWYIPVMKAFRSSWLNYGLGNLRPADRMRSSATTDKSIHDRSVLHIGLSYTTYHSLQNVGDHIRWLLWPFQKIKHNEETKLKVERGWQRYWWVDNIKRWAGIRLTGCTATASWRSPAPTFPLNMLQDANLICV